MRIIFSRKGFDSASGRGPSPIVDGRPVSLPIPDTKGISCTTYGDLGLGDHVARASRGTLGARDPCHNDPMFLSTGECVFGQCGAAQTHLERQSVGVGDVFLFFGLFAGEGDRERHHRIFGYLKVDEIVRLSDRVPDDLRAREHPHALAMHGSNDVVWRGEGRASSRAGEALRLTVAGGPPTLWQRPDWLRPGGLSYHDRATRWLSGRRLRSVSRGQEFVADIGRRHAPREWLARVIEALKAS